LWVALLVLAAFAFLWAVVFRDYRRRHGLTEFRGSMPEPQRHELREGLAEDLQAGRIDADEYQRRLDELDR
ncbi:MAG: hypothetical protein ACLGIN_03450, partial [Candidatus Sericytochromatia bacterium]